MAWCSLFMLKMPLNPNQPTYIGSGLRIATSLFGLITGHPDIFSRLLCVVLFVCSLCSPAFAGRKSDKHQSRRPLTNSTKTRNQLISRRVCVCVRVADSLLLSATVWHLSYQCHLSVNIPVTSLNADLRLSEAWVTHWRRWRRAPRYIFTY